MKQPISVAPLQEHHGTFDALAADLEQAKAEQGRNQGHTAEGNV